MDENLITIKYEDLIRDPQATLCKVSNSCGVEFEDAMMDVRVMNTSAVERKDQKGFDATRVDHWKQKLSKTDIWFGQKICKEELSDYSYPLVKVSPNILAFCFKIIVLPLHWLGSFLLIVIKARRLAIFLKRRFFKLHSNK